MYIRFNSGSSCVIKSLVPTTTFRKESRVKAVLVINVEIIVDKNFGSFQNEKFSMASNSVHFSVPALDINSSLRPAFEYLNLLFDRDAKIAFRKILAVERDPNLICYRFTCVQAQAHEGIIDSNLKFICRFRAGNKWSVDEFHCWAGQSMYNKVTSFKSMHLTFDGWIVHPYLFLSINHIY